MKIVVEVMTQCVVRIEGNPFKAGGMFGIVEPASEVSASIPFLRGH
jgi:hypothetical protein